MSVEREDEQERVDDNSSPSFFSSSSCRRSLLLDTSLFLSPTVRFDAALNLLLGVEEDKEFVSDPEEFLVLVELPVLPLVFVLSL